MHRVRLLVLLATVVHGGRTRSNISGATVGVTNRQEPRLPIAVRSHPAPEPLLNRLHHQIPWLKEKGVRGDLRSNGSRTPTPERGHAETVPGAHGARDKLELQRAFLISCPTRVRFGVQRSVRRSVRPLNACPPEGPEALQACSLFQGTKAWLEPRLEPAETHPGAPVSRSAVLARTSIVLLNGSGEQDLMNRG